MRNKGYIYFDQVDATYAGSTALSYYLRRHTHSGVAAWRANFRAGRVRRGDEVLTEDSVLRAGDTLAYHRPPWDEGEVPGDIPLLAEGEGWMVFAKPSGLPVLPGGGFLENTLLHILRGRYGDALAPVHRLGRGTSGAILCSTHTAAARALSRAMRERRVEKTYLALVQGLPREDAFTVNVPIGKVSHPTLTGVYAAVPVGKPSVSHCRVLRRDAERDESIVEVRIPTGRPHQIRIHCAAAGYPLAGDPLYGPGGRPFAAPDGSVAVPGDGGYTLHSWTISFPDPVDTDERTVTAPPPVRLRHT
ncbi:MAG: RluA family pseudouridine synthase [Bacteroidota bacterium]|nr:RluA family pseudouridine synthase [Bacteroidota bacterium]